MSEFWGALGIVFIITIYALCLYVWGYNNGERDAEERRKHGTL